MPRLIHSSGLVWCTVGGWSSRQPHEINSLAVAKASIHARRSTGIGVDLEDLQGRFAREGEPRSMIAPASVGYTR